MPQIFNAKQISYQLRKSPIPEFSWHTSPKINIFPNREVYRTEDRVDYYLDEDKVSEKWTAK